MEELQPNTDSRALFSLTLYRFEVINLQGLCDKLIIVHCHLSKEIRHAPARDYQDLVSFLPPSGRTARAASRGLCFVC